MSSTPVKAVDPAPADSAGLVLPAAQRKQALAAALLCLAVHGALLFWLPQGAFLKYPAAAEQLASGELAIERVMDFSPLYLELHSVALRVSERPEGWLRWLQIVWVSMAVGLTFLLLRRRFPLWLAAAAALVMIFDRHLLVYGRILEPEALMLLLVVLTLVLLDSPWRAAPWLAGVVAALCLLTRPTFLPVFLLVPVYWWLGHGQVNSTAASTSSAGMIRWRPWLARSALFLAPLLLALLGLSWRAERLVGDSGTPVMNPGTVFFEGNNPLSLGTSAVYPPLVLQYVRHADPEAPDVAHQLYRDMARADAGTLTIPQVNGYWSSRALAFIADHPKHFVRLLLLKLQHAFHAFRWHDIPTAWAFDDGLAFPTFPFALLSALALVGLLVEARHWRRSLLLYALAGSQTVVMLVFYVSARQRIVLLPALLYFAAAALAQWTKGKWSSADPSDQQPNIRHRRWLLLTIVLLLFVALSLPSDAIRDEVYQRSRFAATEPMLAELRQLSAGGSLVQHEAAVIEALATSPWWLEWLRPAYFPQQDETIDELVAAALEQDLEQVSADEWVSLTYDLADLKVELGDTERARALLEPLIATDSEVYRGGRQTPSPRVLQARVAAVEGKPAEARRWLGEALAKFPGDPFALAEVYALGDPAALEELLRYWGSLDAKYLAGAALLRHQKPADAATLLHEVVTQLPDFREARVALAVALGETGRLDEAVQQLLAANRIRTEPIQRTRDVVSLTQAWAALHEDEPQAQLLAIRLLHQHGWIKAAAQRLDRQWPAELAPQVAAIRQRLSAAER